MKNQNGFTLLEAMVVLASIGILMSVVGPIYAQYKTKARHSEAKLALSTIHRLEEAWFAQYETYSSCLGVMGFTREVGGPEYYSVGFSQIAYAGGTIFGNPNQLAVDNGAPDVCASDVAIWTPSDPQPNAHFFQGNQAAMFGSAPTAGMAMLLAGLTNISPDGMTYSVSAIGYLESPSDLSYVPSLMNNSYANPLAELISMGANGYELLIKGMGSAVNSAYSMTDEGIIKQEVSQFSFASGIPGSGSFSSFDEVSGNEIKASIDPETGKVVVQQIDPEAVQDSETITTH
jgi:prepilin-type N-terminal cleavage/methylation domain-containing protein